MKYVIIMSLMRAVRELFLKPWKLSSSRKNFEDAIRNAISIGGDSDTIAAITGGIAGAYYGIPTDIRKHALTFLDERLQDFGRV